MGHVKLYMKQRKHSITDNRETKTFLREEEAEALSEAVVDQVYHASLGLDSSVGHDVDSPPAATLSTVLGDGQGILHSLT